MARSSSGREAHPDPTTTTAAVASSIVRSGRSAGVSPGASSTVPDSMLARRLTCLAALLLSACGARAPAPRPSAPPAGAPTERQFQVREAQIENGAIVVHVEIPPGPPGRKPAGLVHPNQASALPAEGVAAVAQPHGSGPPPRGPATPPPPP